MDEHQLRPFIDHHQHRMNIPFDWRDENGFEFIFLTN